MKKTKLSPDQRRALEQELQALVKRDIELHPPDLLDGLSPPMRAFVLDKSREIFAQCTRRAGKSYSAALKAVLKCQSRPYMKCVIVGLSYTSVSKTFWKDILKKIDRVNHLGCDFNNSSLTMIFPNGSEIFLAAADASEDQKAKLYGQKFDLVVIDEAEAFGTDVRELVEDVLGPAMLDHKGQIVMIGMPCNRTVGFFYDVTTGAKDERGKTKYPDWSPHKWSGLDNPFVADNFRDEIERKRAQDPDIDLRPGFQQMYLNRWVTDLDLVCYRYDPTKNSAPSLPSLAAGRWHYVLGVDLGFVDDTALVVCAYHDHLPDMYVLEAWKKPKLDLTAVAEAIKGFKRRYDFRMVVIDGAAKQAVEELQNRHRIALTPADKQGKADFIDLLSGDLERGRIKLLPDAEDLAHEWRMLSWDPKKYRLGVREEDGKLPNHLADACLYAWRMSYHVLHRPEPVPEPDPRSDQGVRLAVERMYHRAQKQNNQGPVERMMEAGTEWDSSWDQPEPW